MSTQNKNLRALFAQAIYEEMFKNKKIWVLTNDLGYKMWDKIRADFPNRFINPGAAEQAITGIAVGLALEGKIPIVYSITSFLLYRPFETIRNYINQEKLPVKLVGSGKDKDYFQDGPSHWATEDKKIMEILSNIQSVWLEKESQVNLVVKKMLKSKKPWYLNLRRS